MKAKNASLFAQNAVFTTPAANPDGVLESRLPFIPPQMISARRFSFRCGTKEYDLSSRTHLMGVLNVTPDSFSDGGKYVELDAALRRGLELVEEGADFIDVGGESTRPGSDAVPIEEELRRVVPVIEQLVKHTDVPISVDTYKSAVARAALSAGATIVNDISGLTFDSHLAETVARHGATLIIMHMRGTPKTMQQNPEYGDVVMEVGQFLQRQREVAFQAGIRQIMVDPGIGFGKTLEHNLELIRRLSDFNFLEAPL
ncbi:MAG: dihydropteroate synthase, partial [Ignavibacteriales bacterium]|nr:dihydropteroate synthase [Ignavibacteriales bacterium]